MPQTGSGSRECVSCGLILSNEVVGRVDRVLRVLRFLAASLRLRLTRTLALDRRASSRRGVLGQGRSKGGDILQRILTGTLDRLDAVILAENLGHLDLEIEARNVLGRLAC